jgi:Tol biopolymer transport system component/tRNA A-37 threonylcarbamoyl transferase component Bud32
MPVAGGSSLGPYEVLSRLGAGGMGEVYKARDLRLGRTVAIKVLPPHVSADPEARHRFEREAQAIASFSHPHICVLHDVGRERPKIGDSQDAEPVDFLVMEYLEGVTLAERLASGALPMAEALEVAQQVADALDRAHQSGIVHRDLKPANIFLVAGSGITAKLLDFGLARPGGAIRTTDSVATQAVNVSTLATAAVQTPLTAAGTILGTFQYMSPEQIEGREADARADVFAFGAVLYEMLTGRPAFQGSTPASIMAATLASEPPAPSTLAPVSPRIDHIIRRCLEKNAANRWQSIRDVALELRSAVDPRDPLSAALSAPTAAAPVAARRRPWLVAAAAALVAVAALTTAAVVYMRAPVESITPVRFEVPVAGTSFFVSVSPDGRTLVYNAPGADGRPALWIRPLDSLDARLIPSATGTPDWSPDGRSLVFNAEGMLKRIDLAGGAAETIASLPGGGYQRATWNAAGVIVFSNGGSLYRVPASGGEPVLLSQPDTSIRESSHATPSFLPDGRRYLYTAWSGTPDARALYVASIDDADAMKSRVKLMPIESKAIYVEPGYLLYLRNRTLMARPFDVDRLEFTGEARRVADNVLYNPASGAAAFAASSGGTILFRRGAPSGDPNANREWRWVDRTGARGDAVGTAHGDSHVVLSHDATRIAFTVGPPDNADLWVQDVVRGVRTRLTTNAATDVFPVWSPDDTQLVFASTADTGAGDGRGSATTPQGAAAHENGVYQMPANGAVPERLLVRHEPRVSFLPGAIAGDGTIVAVRLLQSADGRGNPAADLWLLPPGGAAPRPYLTTPFLKVQPTLSPNGRWLAYTTNESGTFQVIVQPFPDPSGGKVQVSANGGMSPRWRRDGRELYYINGSSELVAVPVVTDAASFGVAAPATLFPTTLPFPGPSIANVPYEPDRDGKRFLFSLPIQAPVQSTPLVVITSWETS